MQCAWAAIRKTGSYLQAQFHRLRARRGTKKAICAVAASMLTAAYHMLKDGTEYQDLGANHFDQRSKQSQARRLIKRLQDLGIAVDIIEGGGVGNEAGTGQVFGPGTSDFTQRHHRCEGQILIFMLCRRDHIRHKRLLLNVCRASPKQAS